jgi:hypothetical protein
MDARGFWSTPGMRLGVGAIVCAALAVGVYLDALGNGLSAAFQRGGFGMFGLDFPLHETAAESAARLSELNRLLAWMRWETRAAWGLLGTALLCAAGAAWQTRQRVRNWHFLTFLGLPATVGALLVADTARRSTHGRLQVLGLLVLGVVGPAWDLCVPRRGPGRVLAWVALASGLGLAYALRDVWSG